MSAPTPPERAVTICRTDYTLAGAVRNIAMQHPGGVTVHVSDGETGQVLAVLRTPTRHELAPTPAPRVQSTPLAPVFVMPQPVAEPDIDDLDAEDEEAEPYVPPIAESGLSTGDATVYVPPNVLPLSDQIRQVADPIGRGTGSAL